jgi:hypothetical protein
MSWSRYDLCAARLRDRALIGGLLALAAAVALPAVAEAAAPPPPPPPGTCEARPESKTDDVGRTFRPIFYCSTKIASPVYANPFDRKPLDDSGAMNAAANVWVICQKQGRANPVRPGTASNNWWLYTQGDKAVANTYGYTKGWGYLPANVVTQATKDKQVPGVPPCPDAAPAQQPKPPPPPPPGACTDCDADGYPSNVDCNDRIAAINPGVADIPGNAVDEDCSGSPAPFPRLGSTIDYGFAFKSGNRTTFTKLSVGPARAGSTIRVRCTGRGCPFKAAKTRKVSKDARKLNLVKLMRRAKLRPGARLEVRVTKPAMIGTVGRFTVRAGKAPKATFLCLTPGAKRATRCGL